jgi:hypothetical protein
MPLALMDDLRQFLDDKEIGTHFIYDSGQQRAVLRELRHQFYWGRNKMKSPKVLTKGELPFWVFGSTLRPQSNLLIVVEDPISAIAVSRIYDCIPMWGSQFRPEWYAKIKRLGYQDLGFWFDHDKAEEGLKAALSLKGLFNTGWIDTKLDPKYYTEELVSEYVEQAFKKEVVC